MSTADPTILVPLDGSDLAERALSPAFDVARAMGRTVTLLMALDSHSPDPYGDFRSAEGSVVGRAESVLDTHAGDAFGDFAATEKVSVIEAAEKYLRQAAERAGGEELVESVLVDRGRHPADQIVDFVEQAPVAMIVMSTHGRSGIGRWLLGSVTEQVIRSAGVPVLVIPSRDG